MYSSLDKIDIVANGKPGALGKVAYQTDHRQEEEYKEQRALSTLLALARVINPNRVDQEDNERHGVIYVAVARPPDWFRLALASAGAALEIGRTPLAWEGDLADPADLADAAFRELAERVRSRAGRALDDDLLKGLEDEILAEAPSKEADEIRYWTAVMELAAVGGELVRARIGGRWVRDDRWYSTVPFVFQQEGTHTLVNVAGKAERCLERGDGQRVSRLVLALEDSQVTEPEGRILVTLKPAIWAHGPTNSVVYGRPILGDGSADAAIPRVVLCRDRPNSIAMFAEDESRWDERYKQAMANLAAVRVDVQDLKVSGLHVLAVSGDLFAAEKILDLPFMKALQDRLGTHRLAAGVPHRGLLLVTNGIAAPDTLSKVIAICEGYFTDTDGESPISPLPFLVEDGEIVGFLRLGEGGGASEPPKKRGFIARLFGRS